MDLYHPFRACLARVADFIQRQTLLIEAQTPSLQASGQPTPEAETEFNELALALFAFQCEHNPILGSLCRARGTKPDQVSDWRQIPALPTAAFKEFEVSVLPPEARNRVFHSSGTTGQRPSRHFHDTGSLALYEASLVPWFRRHLLPGSTDRAQPGGQSTGLRLVSLTPPTALVPTSSLAHMGETVRQHFGWLQADFTGQTDSSGAWTLDVHRVVSVLTDAARAQEPVLLLGTAFNYIHLLEALQARKLRFHLPAGSRLMETGGYKGRSRVAPKSELVAGLHDWLGVPVSCIVSEYGMSELGSQAYDHVAAQPNATVSASPRRFRFPPWARVQIISPETGQAVPPNEVGLIRVLDLTNAASSLGIQTEDLGVRRGEGFELLGRASAAEPRGCSLLAA
jgi:hypothetical protein